ncbi:MAG: hypothetical protein QF662_01390, partial [Phycisphaerae bacterium]|nr:hypothetical protein [Phycisphaerae bacterium]
MAKGPEWSKEAYEKSVSSRCWWYTPYDAGWDGCREHGADISTDEELGQIVAMEQELSPVPDWATQIVERCIDKACPCGHYLFPLPYLEAISAIGSQTSPTFVHACYTVERGRKRQMTDYVFCLDAWLAGASAEAAASELTALSYRRIDWQSVCVDLWKVLGEHTELKDLLVERVIHSQRWKIKERIWDDDLAADFGRDQYLGNLTETGDARNPGKIWSYVEPPAPGFDQKSSPRLQRLEARLAEICPDWEGVAYRILYGWLCAPKAFRYLECLLWEIGNGRRPAEGEKVPGFLQAEDTYPNQDESAEWWKSFCAALKGWWSGHPENGAVADDVSKRLGETTSVKRWLARLLLHKLRMLERNYDEGLAKLIAPSPGS